MNMSFEDVSQAIASEEPDYADASRLGPDALPHLQLIAENSDPMLASKAAYLASLIEDDGAVSVLETAAKRDDATVRVAAAAGVANLGDRRGRATKVIACLLSDADVGVRRRVLASLDRTMSADFRPTLETLRSGDPDMSIRRAASQVLGQASVNS
jgi:HEAT repeat protein